MIKKKLCWLEIVLKFLKGKVKSVTELIPSFLKIKYKNNTNNKSSIF